MTDFRASVARYAAMTPDLLAQMIQQDEAQQRAIQGRLAAMRKAQRIQKTVTNGGKVPQHTGETR